MGKEDIERLEIKIDELNQRLQLMEERQNSQYTDIMMQFKERTSEKGMIDCRSTDELYEEAENVVIKAGKASTSLLQRKLGIGYSRAAQLIDILEAKGVISHGSGSKPRIVLIKPK